MQKPSPEMKRRIPQTHVLLLVVFLLASSNHHYYYPPIMVQAIGSVAYFKLGTAHPVTQVDAIPNPTTQYTGKQVQGKKIGKFRSGPNPTGNRHAPSKA
ncbi:hypothetical protein AQUCO_02700318v1 [Aquilegia coerulea]|uniref:Uncharacterized protein n=1 Tax=Aquilegia coerulea TaxID=218851 RepID=A0A2G5D6B7_AQUCA|nr:hypothetical protein AQUCO_02700318v1 [Aquilegia coerulea]